MSVLHTIIYMRLWSLLERNLCYSVGYTVKRNLIFLTHATALHTALQKVAFNAPVMYSP